MILTTTDQSTRLQQTHRVTMPGIASRQTKQTTNMKQPVQSQPQTEDQRFRSIVELIATSLEHRKFQASATAVLTKLAILLGCSSARFGIERNHHCRVRAVSHSASFDEKMNLTRVAESAMDEALEQDATVVYPGKPDKSFQVLHAHTEFARQGRAGSVCTLPVNHDGQLIGAITLEHPSANAFDTEKIALCESIAALLGPILNGKLQEERSLSLRLMDAGRETMKNLIGPEFIAIKLLCVVAAVTAGLMFVTTGDYRVSAAATLEGMVQRSVIAPIDGFIMEAKVRAGDIVEEGELLCVLDDKDLKLDRMQWLSEKQKLEKAYRGALGEHNRTQVTILKAQLDQATAKLMLSEDNLARSRISASLSGVIVSGDLSQSLGAPVERGDVLFDIAPLDAYRVMLRVDEREIGQLAEQQSGSLALTGFPNERFTFIVTRITPVSTAEDGSNFFVVEAKLDDPGKPLRPGMQGIGKIDIGERRLGWILTHELTDWLRLMLWA